MGSCVIYLIFTHLGFAELLEFIKRAQQSDILAIDTEFLREKTYYPQLCLLQMATEDEDVIVEEIDFD